MHGTALSSSHMNTCIHAYMHTCIQRGASGASHSRAQRVTHVFTWSTCLHRSHVDHFLVMHPQGVLLAPHSLARSAATLPLMSLGSRERSTWLRHKVGGFLLVFHGVYSH